MNTDNSSVAVHRTETEAVNQKATVDTRRESETVYETRVVETSGRDVPRSVRICAGLLMAGGFIGVAQGALQGLFAFGGVSTILQTVIFGFCGIAGLALWKGSPWATTWALILFAVQIPVIVTAPVVYEAFTGATVSIYAGGSSLGFEYGFGSGFMLLLNSPKAAPSMFGPEKPVPAFGLNLVALLCFFVLVRYRVARMKELG